MSDIKENQEIARISDTPVIVLDVKPISNNSLYGVTAAGRRFKRKAAVNFCSKVEWLLAIGAHNVKLPESRDLELVTRFYMSRKFDTSNCIKLIEDCIANFFQINDRRFAGHRSSRVVVKEGQERIKFRIREYDDRIFKI